MKRPIVLIIFFILLSFFHVEARAAEDPRVDGAGCYQGSLPQSLEIGVSGAQEADWVRAGVTSLISKIVNNNNGKTYTGYPVAIPFTTLSNLPPFSNLPDGLYDCYLATIKNGIQGPWLLIDYGGRVGERPECSPGYRYDKLHSLTDDTKIVDKVEKCRLIPWTYENFNDGFDKIISISMSPADYDAPRPREVQITCEKKNIFVFVWVPYANSVGWSGSAQVKFDKSSAKQVSYWLQKDFDGIYLKNSKTFMPQLTKTKVTFGFKVPKVNGYESMIYNKGNILEYRPIFAKAGCKF